MSKFYDANGQMLFLTNDRNKIFEFSTGIQNISKKIGQNSFLEIKKEKRKVITMFLPDKSEIYPELINGKKYTISDYLFEKFSILENCININCKNILKSNKDKNIFYKMDSHCTIEGFSFIIEELEKILLKNNIIKDVICKSNYISNDLSLEFDLINTNNKNIIKDLGFYADNIKIKNYLLSQEGNNLLEKHHGSKNKDILVSYLKETKYNNVVNKFNKSIKIFNITNKNFYSFFPKELFKIKNKFKNIIGIKNNNINNDKTALIFGDSFTGMYLKYIIGYYFKNSYVLFTPNYDREVVNIINPDIIIFEKASRFTIND